MKKIAAFKMKRLLFYLIFICSLSCNDSTSQSIVRPAYSSYSLGMSYAKAITTYLSNVLSGNYQSMYVENKKLIYETHNGPKGQNYYSILSFVVPPEDTLVLGLTLTYSVSDKGDLQKAKDLLSEGSKNDLMLMMPLEGKFINDAEIVNDLINDLSSSYGKYDIVDTIKNAGIEFYADYKWKNRNDVNITLSYKADKLFMASMYTYYYSIVLRYEYTKSFLETIKYKKSKY